MLLKTNLNFVFQIGHPGGKEEIGKTMNLGKMGTIGIIGNSENISDIWKAWKIGR